MSTCTRITLFCVFVLIVNGLAYGAGDVTTAGRLAITSSSAEASSGSKLFLNAKDYGVVGDGANNDMPAIITLLAGSLCTSGCHIHFPAGVYVVWRAENAGVNIVTDNVTISGDGPATIFRGRDVTGAIPNNRGFPRWNIFDINGHNNLRLQDLAFDGYLTLLQARHANGIYVSNVHGEGLIPNAGNYLMQMGLFFGGDDEDVRISDCTFHNFNDAIYFSAFLNDPNPPYDPITPQTVRNAIVTNNHFENNVAAGGYSALYPVGVYVFYAKDTIIANNTFTNIYSSTSNGTYASGMGYGIYDGDGVSTGLTIANNSINYTGNGATKNATAILVGSDSNTIIRGNNIRSVNGRLVYAIRAFRSTTSTTSEPVANRLIANNVIHVTETDTLTDHYGIWVTSSPAAMTNLEIAGNTIVGNWNTAIKVESEELARVQVLNNLIIGGVTRQIHLLGVSTRSMQQARIAGNRLINGQTQGITLQYAVGTIIENNTILDGNLSNCGSQCVAIEGQDHAFGMIIRNNIIGNTPAGGGLFTVAARYPSNSAGAAIFKSIVYNNNLIGINNGTASWTYFPTASPTNGFYDADYGDIIYNSTLAAGGIPGWVCTKATRTPLTADASSASTTVTVASTTGYAAGDLVMLVKQADMYSELYDTAAAWHTTTIASVTNGTTFVLTTAIPAGDGTYVSGTAQLKRAVFKPLPAIGS